MKKEIVIISGSLKSGGVQKSLINMLNEVDYERYKVDLILLNKEGELKEYLPKQVNLLETPEILEMFQINKKQLHTNIFKFFKYFKLKGSLIYLKEINKGLIEKNMAVARQRLWVSLQEDIPKQPLKYDTAISYQGGLGMYFLTSLIDARKKIMWIHNDYRVLKRDNSIDEIYLKKVDCFIAVSEKCKEIFSELFPHSSKKINVIHNISSKKQIELYSLEEITEIKKENGLYNIVSVGRLDPNKGFDLAIPAINKLIDEGYKIKWYIIGEGPSRKKIANLIKKHSLEKNIFLLGMKKNPYPYVRAADIFLHPSKFEGKSVAIDEAMLLAKPIVVTDYPTVHDQIVNEETGIIVPISVTGIYQGVKLLLNNKLLRKALSENLSLNYKGNEKDIEKVYKIIN